LNQIYFCINHLCFELPSKNEILADEVLMRTFKLVVTFLDQISSLFFLLEF